jgi:hypothetical protein
LYRRSSALPSARTTFFQEFIKISQVRFWGRLGLISVQQLACRFSRFMNMPSEDLRERIAVSLFQGGQQIINIILDCDCFTHTRIMHEPGFFVNAARARTAVEPLILIPKSELPDGDTMAVLLGPADLSFASAASRREANNKRSLPQVQPHPPV